MQGNCGIYGGCVGPFSGRQEVGTRKRKKHSILFSVVSPISVGLCRGEAEAETEMTTDCIT